MSDTKTLKTDAFVGTVLLDEDEKIYLIREEDKNKIAQSRWNLPGGSVDGNETLTKAAKRETIEETGYKTEIKSLLGCYRCKKNDNYWLYVVFEGQKVSNSQKKIDPGVEDGKWFTKNEFLHLDSDQIVHPDMQLVYKIAVEGKGLTLNSVRFIDYDVQ